jgi:precorrin-6B C5,15-methyltransferase / cobalt-precorrin-6B C5,C15-methyltransferase
VTITVIGVDGSTLPPGAADLLAAATLVVGGRRHLDRHAPHGARTVELGDLDPALRELAAVSGPAVVLASGDPGFFGIVRSLRAGGLAPVVLPAVSSVQRLAALVGRSWDDLAVVSAHGRALGPVLNVCRARRAVAVLTGPDGGPAQLGAGLHGWQRTLVVAEELGGPGEQLSIVDAETAALRSWRDPNVLLCLANPDTVPERSWYAGGAPGGEWALPEEEFAHRDGMITKAEVRAVALARLAPRPGVLVWDVGAGSGAVGVECARLGAAVIAVERDPVQCVRIVSNTTKHQVDVRLVEGTAPAALAGLPRPDAVFVGGGGPGVVRTCAAVGADRVVVALAAVDKLGVTRDVLRDAGYAVSGSQVSASRLAELPDGGSRLSAINPVFLLWGMR